MDVLLALVPTAGVLLLFVLAIRAMLTADRRERAVQARMEARADAAARAGDDAAAKPGAHSAAQSGEDAAPRE